MRVNRPGLLIYPGQRFRFPVNGAVRGEVAGRIGTVLETSAYPGVVDVACEGRVFIVDALKAAMWRDGRCCLAGGCTGHVDGHHSFCTAPTGGACECI